MKPSDVFLPRTLPHVPKLYADELLSSWFRRVARYYSIPLSGFISQEKLNHIGISQFDVGLLDIDPPAELLAELSIFTNHSPAVLVTHTLRWSHLGWPLEWFSGVPSGSQDRGWRGVSTPTFCHLCQNEMLLDNGETYVRQDWALAWTTMCPIHTFPLGHSPIDPVEAGVEKDHWSYPPTFSLIGWRRLTAFECALKDCMDGKGLPSDFGGPASSFELGRLLNDLVDRWGEAWGDRFSTLEWITPNLFAPPRRWTRTITADEFGSLPPSQRRWFVAALLTSLSDEAWWKLMDTRDTAYLGRIEKYRALLTFHPRSPARRTDLSVQAVAGWPPTIRDGVRRLLESDHARAQEDRYREISRKRERYEERRAALNVIRRESKRPAPHAKR